MTTEHSIQYRVYFEDTDAGGIVYHANYLHFAERARTEFLRAEGFSHSEMIEDTGNVFAVRNLSIEYHLPAKLDDLLIIDTRMASISGARMEMIQDIKRGDELLSSVYVGIVCVNKNGRATRMPSKLLEIFSSVL